MTRTTTKSRLLTSAVAIALLALQQGTEASISCSSPSGSFQVGDTVSLSLTGNNWWPRLKDVYSITANVYCSSGGSKVTSMSISNGDGWTIPEDVLGRCSGNQMYVQYTGSLYDIAHLAHILPYWQSCDSMTVSARPPPPVTTTKPPTPPTTQPPIPTTTNNPPQPTDVPPTNTNNPPTQPPATTSHSPVYTTTFTLVPTVISGTTTVVPVTTIIVVTPSVIPPTLAPTPGSSTGALVPDNSQLPGLPPSPNNGQNNNGGSQKNSSGTNVPAAALGAVGGVAALALIVFGLVVTRRRRRVREEQATYSVGSKDDYYYDGASSLGTGAAVGAAGAGAAYGTAHHSSDDMSMPSLHHAYAASNIHPPADSSTSYGWDFNTSSAAAGAGTSAGGDTMLPFPVPVTTSDALKQQYDLANRLSVISQDDSMLGFPAVPSTPLQAPASATAAYALNQQLSLKQELDDEDEELHHASIVAAGVAAKTPELYHLPISGGNNNPSPTATTSSQAFVSARGSPGTTTASALGMDGTMRSSAYETVHSNSSAYATANSPSWSASSLQSHDIAIPMPPTTSSAGPSGAGQQANIQDLIRDVLRDD
ncbi:hypothetical protein BGW39_000036 [Mortierella sp. 14UC]|nr:hypothetical protein BGW39_000036 [Mortierella sp. 14UC]